MCGITGFFRLPNARSFFGSPQEAEALLKRMTSAMTHRGPDDDGYLIDGPLWMGMRRLKIIDLAGGRQPIFNEDESVGVVFNGEIYNYIELRRELETRGHRFKTNSDTEVLVHLYEEHGLDFPERLRGMFAFALWDRGKQRLVLGRDPFGIKPLYWGIFDGWLVFGSEIKAVLPCPAVLTEIDPSAVDDHLTLMYIPTPKTIYKHLFKLEPGSLMTIDAQGRRETHSYWRGLPSQTGLNGGLSHNLRETLDRLEAVLSDCVRISLRSDVPLGVFLSGGLDSAAMAYFAKQHKPDLKTFTVSFAEASYDEGQEAQAIARHLGTDHTDIRMEYPKDLAAYASNVLAAFDEPFGDTSALPTYMLCKLARRHLTVCLSGDGGDELFGGYPTFTATKVMRYYSRLPRVLTGKIIPWLAGRLPTSFERVSWDYKIKRFAGQALLDDYRQAHFAWRGAFSWHDRADLYQDSYWAGLSSRRPYDSVLGRFDEAAGAPFMDQLFYVDRTSYLLDEFLVKTDRMSMAHSLEVRPPMLDTLLAEMANQIPAHWKVRGLTTKWIFRRLLKGKLPDSILKLPKKGFTPPLAHWLTDPAFQGFVRESVNAGALASMRVIRPQVVERLLEEHRLNRADHSRKLWVLLGLGLFAERHAKHALQAQKPF
ncbi:MAG: asparagine synthase (glutamine-hydrolyzing) [Elusimicrobia bacterium]|nr:asparagine synthase (glutamine-hydrolyzing) [Elusimicrobiota bacterium]